MKKTVISAFILVCLVAFGTVYVRSGKAQDQNVIINFNGTVIPSTAPIIRTGNVYTLSSNMEGGITVQRNNIILNGNGHIISEGGLQLYSIENVTVENFTVISGAEGIALSDESNVTIKNNNITGTSNLPFEETGGLFVIRGSSNIIEGNNFCKQRGSNGFNTMFKQPDN